MNDNIRKDLRNTAGDVIHTVISTGLESVPFVEAMASELFNLVLTSPVE